MLISGVKIIGICGKKQSGKDTIAQYTTQKYGFEHRKITTPLKEMCAFLFDLNESQLEGSKKEIVDPQWGASPRTC